MTNNQWSNPPVSAPEMVGGPVVASEVTMTAPHGPLSAERRRAARAAFTQAPLPSRSEVIRIVTAVLGDYAADRTELSWAEAAEHVVDGLPWLGMRTYDDTTECAQDGVS